MKIAHRIKPATAYCLVIGQSETFKIRIKPVYLFTETKNEEDENKKKRLQFL